MVTVEGTTVVYTYTRWVEVRDPFSGCTDRRRVEERIELLPQGAEALAAALLTAARQAYIAFDAELEQAKLDLVAEIKSKQEKLKCLGRHAPPVWRNAGKVFDPNAPPDWLPEDAAE